MTRDTRGPGDSRSPVWLAIGGMAAMAAAIGVGRFIYTPILPLMVEGLGMSKTLAGTIASANFAGYLLGAIAAASRALPGSPRMWLMVALLVSAVTTGGMGAMGGMDSTPAFFVLRFLGGFASAFVLVFSSSLVLERLAFAGRAGLSAIHFAGVGVGIATSALLVSTIMAAGGQWRALWLAGGLLSLLALAVVVLLIPGQAPPRPTAPAGTDNTANGQALRNLVIAYGLFGFGYVITATFLVDIVRASADLRRIEPVIWLVVGLSAAPSVALWAATARRIGNNPAFAIACVLEALGVAASVYWPTLPGIILCAVLLGGTFVAITAIGLVEARRLAPGDASQSIAIMTVAFGLGQIIGPSFAGFLHDRAGSFLLPSLGAMAALLAAAWLVLPNAAKSRPAG